MLNAAGAFTIVNTLERCNLQVTVAQLCASSGPSSAAQAALQGGVGPKGHQLVTPREKCQPRLSFKPQPWTGPGGGVRHISPHGDILRRATPVPDWAPWCSLYGLAVSVHLGERFCGCASSASAGWGFGCNCNLLVRRQVNFGSEAQPPWGTAGGRAVGVGWGSERSSRPNDGARRAPAGRVTA